MPVESISFGGVGRDSGACNSCPGAESVLPGGWRLSLLTAVAVCSHHREALASPDVPGITHILNGGGGERLLTPIFSVLGAHYWGIVRGGFEVYPPPQRAILNGHSLNTSSEPPPPPQTTLTAPRWVCHTGILCFRPKSSQRGPAVRSQGGYEALSLCSQASLPSEGSLQSAQLQRTLPGRQAENTSSFLVRQRILTHQ